MARILVIASFTPSLINFRGALLKLFCDLGHEVLACSPEPDEETVHLLDDLGIRHIEYPLQRTGMNPKQDLRTLSALRQIIQRERPDHVLAYTIKPVIYGCLAARKERVPHIHALITGLGTSFQGRGLKRKALSSLVSRLYRSALKGCENVIFQNSDDLALFEERSLADKAQLTVVNGSGIDLERFSYTPLGDHPAPHFLLIARLIREKGVETFAEAARKVKAQYPEAVFRIVGYFESHPAAIKEEEMASWTKQGILEFLGSRKDVREPLKESSIYCLPSYREGMPRTILEALAIGRPIITTDAPGCRDTVVEGENGLIVPVRDVDALAEAMSMFCRNPERIRSMGARSRALAESRFDVHEVNESLRAAMGL
jgi:glycosyltransferase involved in cell wall biosynthesis